MVGSLVVGGQGDKHVDGVGLTSNRYHTVDLDPAAAVAAVHKLCPLAAVAKPDRLHQTAAVAAPVARFQVDVQRV